MSIAFDASYYLLSYPDVAAAVVRGQFPNAFTHFVLHGARELRNPNARFNAADYAGMNPDVANAVAAGTITSVWDHYVVFGIAENRAPSLALKGFDAARYLSIHTDVAAAVTAGAFRSAIEHYLLHGLSEGRSWGEDVPLTSGTDKLIGNRFIAGLVYTPGGNDRINALQDEDELTGIGVNPTLIATLGNANDNGGSVITPILRSVETVNVAFTGSDANRVHTLDLQDATGLTRAVNITRITDELANVTIRNLTSVPAELSLSNTHSPATAINFTFLASATAGTADATQVNLSNATVGSLKVEAQNGANGVETITINSRGAPNSIGTFTAQDLRTLNITGDQSLTITSQRQVRNAVDQQLVETVVFTGGLANVAGSLGKIDGSTATGNLTLNLGGIFNATRDGTSGTNIAVEVQGGKGNDSFIISDDLNANDRIDGGEGANTLILTAGTISGTVARVQTLDIRTDAVAVTVDTSRLADLATVIVRNEGNDNAVPVAAPAATPTVVTLDKLSTAVAENTGIVVKHGTSGNNDLSSLTVVANLATASGANDKLVFTLAEGVNADPRFNVSLVAGGSTNATRVESVAINDSDSESNTIRLGNNLEHTGTITLKGGVAGTFLNLDWSENALRRDVSGLVSNDKLGVANNVGSNVGALVASVIDAEAFVGDAIIRVSSSPLALSATGAQTVKLGSGNDTLIFDNLNDSYAGLTIADTVSGGAGNDTLAIGGNEAVRLTQSEWINITGFETIRLLGNGASYSLTLTDALITGNAADGKVINIINDNDPANDVAAAAVTAGVGAVSAATIDARTLSAGISFTYNGEEGGARTADRFIFADQSLAGLAVIDGGAVDNDPSSNSTRNDDILEVRNGAVISAGDLQNIRNVGTIELTNDRAATRSFTLQLNDAVVDALVDSYHASSAAEVERLAIRAYDNSQLPAATTATRLEAGALTAKSGLDVLLGRGINNVASGAGDDRVVLLGNYASGIYPADTAFGQFINVLANNIAGPRIVTDEINLGGGIDRLVTYGVLNVAGARQTAIEHVDVHGSIAMTAAQLNALTSLSFVGGPVRNLYVVFEPDGPATVDFSRITVLAGDTLYYNLDAGLTVTGTASGTIAHLPAMTAANIGSFHIIPLVAHGVFAGNPGQHDVFQGDIASLDNAVIGGNATDQDTLQLTSSGTVVGLGGGGAGATITDVHSLVLANGNNDVSFAGMPGFRAISGHSSIDSVDVSGIVADFATGGAVALHDGDDTLTLGAFAYTGSLHGGAGTDRIVAADGTDISGATVSGFETLNLTAAANTTLTVAQHNSFTTVDSAGATTLHFKGDAGTITLNPAISVYDFAAITQGLTITTSGTAADVTVIGSAGDDLITVMDEDRRQATVDLSAGGADTVVISNGGFDPTGDAGTPITGFTAGIGAGSDRIRWLGNSAGLDVISAPVTGDFTDRFIAIPTVMGTVGNLFDVSNGGDIETLLASAFGASIDYGAGFANFYAVVYGAGGGAALVHGQTNSGDLSGGVGTGDFSLELMAVLDAVAGDGLVPANFIL